jgi:CheY-like chemotaxis protein
MGHRVLVAGDGMAVVRILEQRKVDLTAIDMRMPILDGVEPTRKIRAMEKGTGKHAPIVAMAANAFEEDRCKCLETSKDSRPRRHANLENAIASWKSFPPVRLLARRDSRTINGLRWQDFPGRLRLLRVRRKSE